MDKSFLKDRYGFLFWLSWILWFAISFIIAAAFWTFCIKNLLGEIQGAELTVTWSVCVFGSWFILIVPFMRKKEQIWKRLNKDQEKAVDAWLAGVVIFIGFFILSAFSWSLRLKPRLAAPGLDPVWVKAVFGTWIAMLIPFLIIMYRKADQIFQEAKMNQTYAPKFQVQWMDVSKRILPDLIVLKLRKMPPLLRQGHLVTIILKDGRRKENVFVRNSEEIVGIYDQPGADFDATQVVDIEPADPKRIPVFDESKWIRFDINP